MSIANSMADTEVKRRPGRPRTKPHQLHLYFSEEDYALLQDAWASAFAEHRLPFGVWLVRQAIEHVTAS